MIRTYKYRVYANAQTIENANRWIELCRCLYNCALKQRIIVYKSHNKCLSYIDQQNQLPELRNEFIEYRNMDAQSTRNPLYRIDRAFKRFFKEIKEGKVTGFPRFKSENRYNSFVLYKQGWRIDGKQLIVRNIGKFKLNLSRPIQGDIKEIAIKRKSTNKWYASFVCEVINGKELPKSDKIIGLDVGIKSYLTDSEGNKVENPKYLKNTLEELRIKNRKLARAKKGSNRRKKIKLVVAKLHEHIVNQRDDFLHKLANQYVNEYGVIKVENLQIENMIQNHSLSRDISDCAWGKFFYNISYKAEEAGRKVIKVNPKNTSRRCNICGAINHDLKLSDRIWICQACGAVHDRDHNAAINMRDSEAWAKPSVANVKQKFVRRPSTIVM